MSVAPNEFKPETHLFEDDGSIPNSTLPFLLYRGVFSSDDEDLPRTLERAFAENGWTEAWRDGVYSYHHYHSTSHEVLGIYRGRATVQMGGDKGQTFDIQAGDVLVIPAGVGHKNLRSSVAFGVVGAYPDGRDHDLLKGDPADRPEALENIAEVPIPTRDPVFGPEGPLVEIWKKRQC